MTMASAAAAAAAGSRSCAWLLPMLALAFIDLLATGLVSPILTAQERRLGVAASVSAQLKASFALAQMLSSPLIGAVSDRVGVLPTFTISTMLVSIAHLILASSTSAPPLFAARILSGVAWHSRSLAISYVAAQTRDNRQQRSAALHTLSAVLNVAMMSGPAIGGVLFMANAAYPFLLAAALFAANAVLLLLVLLVAVVKSTPQSPPKMDGGAHDKQELLQQMQPLKRAVPGSGSRSANVLLERRENAERRWSWRGVRLAFAAASPLLGVFLLHFCIQFALNCHKSSFPFFVLDRIQGNAESLGFLTSFSNLVAIAYQVLGARHITASLSDMVCLQLASGGIAATLAMLPITSTMTHLLMLSVPHAIALSVLRVATMSLVTHNAPEKRVATVVGVSTSVGSVAKLLGLLSGGYMYQQFGSSATALLAAALSGVCFVFAGSVGARLGPRKRDV